MNWKYYSYLLNLWESEYAIALYLLYFLKIHCWTSLETKEEKLLYFWHHLRLVLSWSTSVCKEYITAYCAGSHFFIRNCFLNLLLAYWINYDFTLKWFIGAKFTDDLQDFIERKSLIYNLIFSGKIFGFYWWCLWLWKVIIV